MMMIISVMKMMHRPGGGGAAAEELPRWDFNLSKAFLAKIELVGVVKPVVVLLLSTNTAHF